MQDIRFPDKDFQEMPEEISWPKNNKAPEVDQLPGVHWALQWAITKIWEDKFLLQVWMECVVCSIYKKGR